MKNEFDAYARVQELAALHGMTLSSLAKTCGINPSTLSIVRKRGGQPRLETITRICDGLDMTVGEFFNPPKPGNDPSKPLRSAN